MDWKILDFDSARQQVPFMAWKRFLFNQPAEQKYNFSPQLQYGYGYLLREIMYKALYVTPPNHIQHPPEYRIELFQKLNWTELQNTPYPPSLISSPGESDVLYMAAPAPYDNLALNVCATAAPQIKNRIILNIFYQYRENIEVKISSLLPGEFYFDLLLFGYLIPEKNLKMWS